MLADYFTQKRNPSGHASFAISAVILMMRELQPHKFHLATWIHVDNMLDMHCAYKNTHSGQTERLKHYLTSPNWLLAAAKSSRRIEKLMTSSLLCHHQRC